MNRRKFLLSGGACIIGGLAIRSASAVSSTVVRADDRTCALAIDYRDLTSWIKSCVAKPISELVESPRFAELLAETDSGSGKVLQAMTLQNLVRARSAVPGETTLSHGRYLSAYGCMNHCGFNRVFLWIDTKTAVRIRQREVPQVLILLVDVDGSERRVMFVTNGDLTVGDGTVPGFFQRGMRNWMPSSHRLRKLYGGRFNEFEVHSPVPRLQKLTPKDIGIRFQYLDYPLVAEVEA